MRLAIALSGLVVLTLNSCVSSKKYGELKDKYEKLDEEKKYLTQQNQKLETDNKEFNAEREAMEKGVRDLTLEMENIKSEIEQLEEQNKRLKTYNADLNKSLEAMKSGTRAENKKLLALSGVISLQFSQSFKKACCTLSEASASLPNL